MGIKWPESPGPEEWYLEAIPEKCDTTGKFSGVWVVIRSMAYPAHRHDYKFIKLQAPNFEWQWDFALKQGKALVSRLNFAQRVPENPASKLDARCAECGEPACPDDYLCDNCGHSVRD